MNISPRDEDEILVIPPSVDHALQDFDYHVAKKVWNAIAMNADLVGNPEGVRKILCAASEPPQRPAARSGQNGFDNIDPSLIDYAMLVDLVRRYQAPEEDGS